MSNISFSDFSNNFVTHIKGFEVGHTDETGTYDYGVGFHVVCTNNNRVMYFESHISSNDLPPSFNNSNVVDVAWSNLLPNVKTWATSVLGSSNILGKTFTPSVATDSNLDFSTTNNFDYATFSNNFVLKVSRMETYPEKDPWCWCVGFTASPMSNDSLTLAADTVVNVNTFAIYKAEQEILDLGWSNLKERYGLWAEPIYNENSFTNTLYAPSNW
jgi:hypothetical protein